jgi:hypothetical protein
LLEADRFVADIDERAPDLDSGEPSKMCFQWFGTIVSTINDCVNRLQSKVVREGQASASPMMLPGVSISTKPDDYAAFKVLRIAVFDGASWNLSGEPLSAD